MEKGYHKGQKLSMSELGLSLEETIPLLYVEGLSTRDFKRALKPLWGKSSLSRSSASRANKAIIEYDLSKDNMRVPARQYFKACKSYARQGASLVGY